MNVSTYENGKLVSPYLGIDSILDGVKKTNELNNKAYGVLVCLSVCDVLFNENTKKNLNDEFDSMILECNTDDDFKHVDEMLSKAALEGGSHMDTETAEVPSMSEEEFLITPVHDTGSKWYTFLSFLLFPIGLIAGLVFKHFNHKRNAKACMTGVKYGVITLLALLVLFAILLVLVVV